MVRAGCITKLTRRRRSGSSGLGFLGSSKRSISSGEEDRSPSEGKKRFAAVWGNGDYGRLGLGSLESQWRPAFCSSFGSQNLQSIACGGAHTLFLTGFSIVSSVLHSYSGFVVKIQSGS